MRSCLVMGSGRSGTSMLAGTIIRAGYFGGESLWPESPSNQKGFYEDAQVNRINERLLAPVTDGGLWRRVRGKRRFDVGQRWLAVLPPDAEIGAARGETARDIQALTATEPFCLKDPRFSYTLPSWRPFVGDAAFLCIFRDPIRTMQSILRECERQEYLASLE